MAPRLSDPFGARSKLGEHYIYRLDRLTQIGAVPALDRLPFSIRILLESVLRNCDGYLVTEDDVRRLAGRVDGGRLHRRACVRDDGVAVRRGPRRAVGRT